MQVATHLATALLLQADCARVIAAVEEIASSPRQLEVAISQVRQLRCRWSTFVAFHFVFEPLGMVLLLLDAFFVTKEHQWGEVLWLSLGLFAILCLILCQVLPLVAYHEAVRYARQHVDDFPTAQRLNREPLEFTVLGTIIDRAAFQRFFAAGTCSILSILARKLVG